MTVNRNTDRRFPHSKLAKLLHYNGSDLNSIGRRTGVCLFDYGMTTQEWGHRNTENPGKAKPRPGILAKNIFASKY